MRRLFARIAGLHRLLAASAALAGAVAAQSAVWTYRLQPSQFAAGTFRPLDGALALDYADELRFVGYDAAESFYHAATAAVPTSPPLAADVALPTRQFAVELWVAVDAAKPGAQLGLASLQGGATDRPAGFHVGIDGEHWSCGATVSSGPVVLRGVGTVVPGAWTHLVATFDGRRLQLYVNGVADADGEAKGTVDFGAEPRLRIGGAVLGGAVVGASAAVHTVRIYDRALTKANVAKIAKQRPKGLLDMKRASVLRHSHPVYALDQRSEQIERAIHRGCLWLLEQQDDAGAFHDFGAIARTGLTALVVLAVVEAGEDPDSDAIRLARAQLRQNPPVQTYDLGTCLLMLGAIRDDADRQLAEQLTKQLLSFESKALPGAWAYPESEPDLSNTQFAALGLLGAAQFGIEIPRDVFERMVAVTAGPFRGRPQRVERGGVEGSAVGFSYRIKDRNTSATMTTAAASIFAIADRVAQLKWDEMPKVAQAKQQCLNWIAANYEDCLGPYAIYGVERTAALLGLTHFGKHDWYQRAVDNILGYQAPDGSWAHQSISDSAFNLLVLRRATRRLVQQAPLTGAGTVVQQRGPLRFCYRREAEPVLWFAGFADEWAARQPRVVRVRWLVDGAVVATIEGEGSAPWSGQIYKVRPKQLAEGMHETRVEVDVVDGAGKSETVVGAGLLVGRK